MLAGTVTPMLEAVLREVPASSLAVHFHNTYGLALVNIVVALQVFSTHIAQSSGVARC